MILSLLTPWSWFCFKNEQHLNMEETEKDYDNHETYIAKDPRSIDIEHRRIDISAHILQSQKLMQFSVNNKTSILLCFFF